VHLSDDPWDAEQTRLARRVGRVGQRVGAIE
jgi:hypothetical protein